MLAIPLTGVDGARLGWLVWHAKSPGPTILRRAAPMLWVWLLFFVGVVVGGGVILRRMWRVTRELLVSEAQARHNALHDGMSGLPNRMYYMQRLHEELARHLAGKCGETSLSPISISTGSRGQRRSGTMSGTNLSGRSPCGCAMCCRQVTSSPGSGVTNSS
jgi:hypothetical protein